VKTAYLPHIDGLRALAVLAVMVYHLQPAALPGGFVGVDMFFVISGYVVTASLAAHRDESGGRFLGEFYARRMARLIPALVTMLVVVTALYVLLVPKAWFNRAAETTGQMAFFGLSNWWLDRQVVNYFEPRAEWNPFTHTWSLGVEEQFYLVVPLLLLFVLGSRHSRRSQLYAVAAIVVLAALSLLACYALGFTRGSRYIFYQLGFRFWELACGVLLYLWGARIAPLRPSLQRWYRWSGWAGLLLVLVAMTLPRPSAFPWIRATVAVAGTVLLIGLPGAPLQGPLQRALGSRPAVWIGLRSYALYLWHWPIFVLMRWTTGLTVWPFNALGIALSFALAAASYRFVENPLRYSARLRSAPASLRLSGFLLLMVAGWVVGSALLQAQPRLSLAASTRNAPDWYGERQLVKTELAHLRQCEPLVRTAPLGDVAAGITSYLPQGCSQRAGASLFVIGDSHALAYSAMLEQLSAEQGRTVHVLQAPGCAYIDLLAPLTPATDARCHELATSARQAVLAMARPGDVVLLASLRLPRLIHLGGETRQALDPTVGADVYSRTRAELQSLQAAVLDGPLWFEPFVTAGLRVVFELPKPVFRAHPFQCVDTITHTNPVCRGGLVEERQAQERYRAPVVSTIHTWTQTYTNVLAWDPLPALCDTTNCEAVRDGRPLFFDGDHISPYGNLVLLASLRDRINDLAP
jgi:peptidoglycan/LPS O-acetylase OafA/YrhL